jgi:hypothetical protein
VFTSGSVVNTSVLECLAYADREHQREKKKVFTSNLMLLLDRPGGVGLY